jgi:hypothetical protein
MHQQAKCLRRVIMACDSNNSTNMGAQPGRDEGQHLNSKSAGVKVHHQSDGTLHNNSLQVSPSNSTSKKIHTQYMAPPPTRPRCSQPGAAPCTMSAARENAALTTQAMLTTVRDQPAAEASESKEQRPPQGPLRRRADQEVSVKRHTIAASSP